jgi:hypothetical protein
MSCQASINGSVEAYGVNKYKRKIALTIGLLCSKTFTYDGQQQVLAEHGIDIADVVKINIKGRYQVWTRDGGYHEIPLKLFHPYTRPGLQAVPGLRRPARRHLHRRDRRGRQLDPDPGAHRTRRGVDEGRDRRRADRGPPRRGRPGRDEPAHQAVHLPRPPVSRKRWPEEPTCLPDDLRSSQDIIHRRAGETPLHDQAMSGIQDPQPCRGPVAGHPRSLSTHHPSRPFSLPAMTTTALEFWIFLGMRLTRHALSVKQTN